MDFWDDTTRRLYADMEHRERIAQGDAARRLAHAFGRQPVRVRLARGLVALAARLAPADVRGPGRHQSLVTPHA